MKSFPFNHRMASLFLAATIFAAGPAPTRAEEQPDWQGKDSWFGFKLYGALLSVGGLSFKWAEVQGKSPHLFRDSEFAATLSQHNYEIPYWGRFRMGPLGHLGTGASNENKHTAIENSWSHCVISYPSYKIHLSRLTPAVLLETAGDCVVFSNEIPNIKLERGLNYNPQPAFPRFMAWLPAGDEATQTAAIAGNDEISLGGALQDVNWALLWCGNVFDSHKEPLSWAVHWTGTAIYGGGYKGDMPALLVFSQPVESIEISESNQSLAFFFPEKGVKAAMVLPWERFFQLVDTSAWTDALIQERRAEYQQEESKIHPFNDPA